jgi:two-component system cell cycle sensor histidine kinase/response regulator CckA
LVHQEKEGPVHSMSEGGKTILLVVDDEASQRERMRRALRTAGFHVMVAKDYPAAVAAFQQYPGAVDMVVTDLALPGKNGYQLGMDLCALQPRLKVLYTSAQVGAELHRFYGMSSTDQHFLAKPFQPAELLRRVRYLLERAEPMRESTGA